MTNATATQETFVVQVMSTQNSTWQGVVTWQEGGREESFRSALELLQLMESAIVTTPGQKA